MFSNGNVTVYVSDMDAAIRFFTNALGLTLTNRFGRQWATIHAGPSYWTTDEVGAGLIIGLHPRSAKAPEPGTVGAIGFGVETYEPLTSVIPELTKRGVRVTSEIISFEAGNSVGFEDADGHASFVHEFPPFMLPESDLQGSSSGGRQNAGRDVVGRPCDRLCLEHGRGGPVLLGNARPQPDEPLRR